MAYLDQLELARIWKCISSQDCMDVLKELSKKEPLVYSELKAISDYPSNVMSYYIRKLKTLGFIRKDGRYYFLTRVGLQTIKTIKAFEKQCMKYDMADCDADGKVIAIIQRNKVERAYK